MTIKSITGLNPDTAKNNFYFENKNDGITVGFYDKEIFGGEMVQTSLEEFIHVIEGSISIELTDGQKEVFGAGQTFVIPKGLTCRREQSGKTKTYFMTFEDEMSSAHPNVAEIGVIRLDPSDSVEEIFITDTSQFLGAVPKHYKHGYYTDTTGRFLVAMWNSDPFERAVAPFNRHELMIFLKGSVTLSDGDAVAEHFKAEDVAFVPHQAPYKWKNDEYLSKYYCIVMPK